MDNVYKFFIERRKYLGYTQDELSDILGITKQYLSNIENNKKNPSDDLIEKLKRIEPKDTEEHKKLLRNEYIKERFNSYLYTSKAGISSRISRILIEFEKQILSSMTELKHFINIAEEDILIKQSRGLKETEKQIFNSYFELLNINKNIDKIIKEKDVILEFKGESMSGSFNDHLNKKFDIEQVEDNAYKIIAVTVYLSKNPGKIRIWKDLDEDRDINKQATARAISLNQKGRSGSKSMNKYTEDYIKKNPKDTEENILEASSEILLSMLNDIININKNTEKRERFINTLSKDEGLYTLFLTQVINAINIYQNIYQNNPKGTTVLSIFVDIRNTNSSDIRKYYKKYYDGEIDYSELKKYVSNLISLYGAKISIDKNKNDEYVRENKIYDAIKEDSILNYIMKNMYKIKNEIMELPLFKNED